MSKLGFAIPLRVTEAIVNDPILISFGVVINQVDDPAALDHAVRVAALLAAHTVNLEGLRLVQHRVVKQQITIRVLHE